MRIAYIAPYQGLELVKRRPSLDNLSLGARAKIELIAELLRNHSHDVEIISQGPVDRSECRFYPSFSEPNSFHPDIPIFYSSAFPLKYLTGCWESMSARRLLRSRHKYAPFDVVLIYGMKRAQIGCANWAMRRLGLPVILEYEDDLFPGSSAGGVAGLHSKLRSYPARQLLHEVSGCISNSLALLAHVTRDVPKLLLCGVVSKAILEAGVQLGGTRCNRIVFSGTHSKAQGLEQLIKGWRQAKLSGWELHIAGRGAMTDTLHALAENDPSIIFHGVLSRDDNARMLGAGKISIVPYDISQTIGFSFKTIECLAAGLHVITTRLQALEGLSPGIKTGITYLEDNSPETIASCLKEVIAHRHYERTAVSATVDEFGPDAVGRSLDEFLRQVAPLLR